MAYENNHYVPQFILRQFGDYLNVYNVKDCSLHSGMLTSNIFSERKIYPADLEKAIGYNLESPFAKLFHEKLMSGKCGETDNSFKKRNNANETVFPIGNNPCLFNA